MCKVQTHLIKSVKIFSWHQFKQLIQNDLHSSGQSSPSILPKLIILVEGATEQILLPYFASAYNVGFAALPIGIIPVGGSQQMARRYKFLQENIDVPIFCVFDRDAAALAEQIIPQLRKQDSIHILADGEIEDILQLDFFVDCLNQYLASDLLNDLSKPIAISDFADSSERTLVLEKIWRERELGKFEKVKFAEFITQIPCRLDLISQDGQHMLDKLFQLVNQSTTK